MLSPGTGKWITLGGPSPGNQGRLEPPPSSTPDTWVPKCLLSPCPKGSMQPVALEAGLAVPLPVGAEELGAVRGG